MRQMLTKVTHVSEWPKITICIYYGVVRKWWFKGYEYFYNQCL